MQGIRLLLLLLLSPILADRVSADSINPIEWRFIQAGLVDVRSIDPSLRIDLVNADADKNFFGEDFYGGLERAYLRPEVAEKLAEAQRRLRQQHPGYSLEVLDAARPRSVSQRMYDQVQGARFERFVANPATGSMHNYGIAVDITLIDADGRELDMGPSPFRKSSLAVTWQYILTKLGSDLSDEQRRNRRLLAEVMAASGFHPLGHEWWHFNGMPKAEARRRFQIIE